MPFSRGNSPERIESAGTATQPAEPQPEAATAEQPARQGLPLPDSPSAQEPRAAENRSGGRPSA